jgi:hypothetical protein
LSFGARGATGVRGKGRTPLDRSRKFRNQSALAREYGFESWNQLRSEVARRNASSDLDSVIAGLVRLPLPAEVLEAIRSHWGERLAPDAARSVALPRQLPLLAARDVVIMPGALVPLHVARPISLAAVRGVRERRRAGQR